MLRGQAQLEAMRRRGHAPDAVFIDCGGDRLRMAEGWASQQRAHLAANGPVSQADLRCIVGLTVFVGGGLPCQIRAMRDACVRAKAKRVIATICEPRGEVFECVEVTDTEGLLSWPN